MNKSRILKIIKKFMDKYPNISREDISTLIQDLRLGGKDDRWILLEIPKDMHKWYSDVAEMRFLDKKQAPMYMVVGLDNFMEREKQDAERLNWMDTYINLYNAIDHYLHSKKMQPFSDILYYAKMFIEEGYIFELRRDEDTMKNMRENLFKQLAKVDVSFLSEEKQKQAKELFASLK